MDVFVSRRYSAWKHASLATMLALSLAGQSSAAPRKPRHAAPEATSRDTDTSTTGAIPTKPPKPAPATSATADDEVLPPPFHLPLAPRARMRDCGVKWQTMKMSGEVGEQTWRDFATRCLAAASGPGEKRSER